MPYQYPWQLGLGLVKENCISVGKKQRDGVELTVVSLPPSKGPFSDEVVENETKNEPKRILG